MIEPLSTAVKRVASNFNSIMSCESDNTSIGSFFAVYVWKQLPISMVIDLSLSPRFRHMQGNGSRFAVS